MVTNLKENQVFVFGSNLAGSHGGGAALQAKQWGAIDGKGEGLAGQTYAFPTLGKELEQLDHEHLTISRDNLYKHCETNPNKEFLLTKVGCGIAGYPEEYMKSLFTNPPKNLVLPDDWK